MAMFSDELFDVFEESTEPDPSSAKGKKRLRDPRADGKAKEELGLTTTAAKKAKVKALDEGELTKEHDSDQQEME